MEKEKFIFGPIQTAWLASLKEHPERQTKGRLGYGDEEQYQACCLGELHIIGCRMLGKPAPFINGEIVVTSSVIDNNRECSPSPYNVAALVEVGGEYGLYTSLGYLQTPFGGYVSLSSMNDQGMTWPQIAEYVEYNPHNVFSKSV